MPCKGVTSKKGILCTLTICWLRIQRSSKSKNCPKPHCGRENDRFHDMLQKLPNRSVHWLGTVPQPVPKTMPRITVVLSERSTLLRKP
jgi:hypothetical protein